MALLGTGIMGVGMARNIAAAGLPLQVWNRTREKAAPLADAGATVADSPADAVRGADIVITMLFDADSPSRPRCGGAEGLDDGAVLLQQSTVGVEGAERLAQVCRRARSGVRRRAGARHQEAGRGRRPRGPRLGPGRVRERIAPVLDAIGCRTVWVGAAGQGSGSSWSRTRGC